MKNISVIQSRLDKARARVILNPKSLFATRMVTRHELKLASAKVATYQHYMTPEQRAANIKVILASL